MQYLLGDDEHLRALVNNRGWKLFQAKITITRADLVRQLVGTDADAVATARLRGFIRAFDLVLECPTMLMEEISEAVPTED